MYDFVLSFDITTGKGDGRNLMHGKCSLIQDGDLDEVVLGHYGKIEWRSRKVPLHV